MNVKKIKTNIKQTSKKLEIKKQEMEDMKKRLKNFEAKKLGIKL